MKKKIKKNVIGVTSEKKFEKMKLISGEYPYSIHSKESELFSREFEVTGDNKVYKDKEVVLELNDYHCLFIVVEGDDKYYVYGDSPLHYLDDAIEVHQKPVKFEEFEKVVGQKLNL
jgi:hypothetical protein